jgi:hypothetical protein
MNVSFYIRPCCEIAFCTHLYVHHVFSENLSHFSAQLPDEYCTYFAKLIWLDHLIELNYELRDRLELGLIIKTIITLQSTL